MDVLRRAGRVAVVALALIVASCLVFRQFGFGEPVHGFPHSKHGASAGLECDSCHRNVMVAEQAGMPTLAQCRLCHQKDKLDEGKPLERTPESFYADGGLAAPLRTHPNDEVIFSHKTHVGDRGLACTQCHGDVGATDAVPADVRVTMAACMDCHAKSGMSNDCAECHVEIRADVAPADHAFDWTRAHGRAYRHDEAAKQQNCTLCHARSSCEQCHHTEMPQDHTNYWRQRGHGVAVSIDRSRCYTCHQSDTCERCHHDTAPMSHTAGWGSPRDRHCVVCHLPSGASDGCNVCHRGTPSHLLATPLPVNPAPPVPPHTPGMNCRQCHGVTAPLPHPDKGDSCIDCHR